MFQDEEKKLLSDSITRLSQIIKANQKLGKELRGEEPEETEE